jgi:hypothetical protein
MSSKIDLSGLLNRISEPVREKFPEMASRIAELSNDKEFQNIIGRLGTIGGLINIGIYLYKRIKEGLKSDEQRYFAALMTLMFKSAQESLSYESQDIKIPEIRSEEYIRNLFVLFMENIDWNSAYLPEHPAVRDFRIRVIEILARNEDQELVKKFAPGFNHLIQTKSAEDPILVKFKERLTTNVVQDKLSEYLEEVMSLWEQPSPIDNKALGSYYIENRAYEIPVGKC